MINFFDPKNEFFKEIFSKTQILRKPINGIVSGYHELPYILVAPNEDNNLHSLEINGKINVSPKFIISSAMLNETFGNVFDPETFDKDLQGRFFSFTYSGKRNIKIENEYFHVKSIEESPEEHSRKILDGLLQQENITTGLIVGPAFKYYPVSIDRFINEIMEREFNI
jgi:hypothetical protein